MGSRLRHILVLTAIIFVAVPVPELHAQPATFQNRGNIFNWAYAAAFGTGMYRIGDDDVFVFRVMPEFRIWDHSAHRLGLDLRVPVAFGLGDFDIADLPQVGVPDRLSTVSIVPGLELEWEATPRWTLKPFAHFGWGTEIGGEANAWTYYAGVNSLFDMVQKPALVLRLLNGIQWFGYSPNLGEPDQFIRLALGTEGDIPMPGLEIGGHTLLFRPHLIYYWYMDDLDARAFGSSSENVVHEVEIAAAVGREKPFAIWFFEFDRVGVGYRQGDDIEGIRFFMTAVFE